VKIDVDDTGKVNVASSDADGLARAIQMISDITAVPEVGKTYLGKVVRLAEFGAFVEIFPGTDGLLHVSEIAEHRVKEVKDELREGDQVLVKVLAIEGNRIKLSRKAVLREQREKLGLPPAPDPNAGGERSDRGDRGDRGDRDRGPRPDRGGRGERSDRGERPTPPKAAEVEPVDDEEFDDEEFDGEDEGGDEIATSEQPAEGVTVPAGDKPAGQQRRGRRRRGRRPGGGGAPQGGGSPSGGNQ
jgi:polyribonucleotide nucleotidyltransferase